MAKRPTTTDITAGYGSATKINANIAAIKAAFDNTVSRDGSTPNSMSADFDMNNNDLLNVKDAFVDTLTIGGVQTSVISQAQSFAYFYDTVADLKGDTVLDYGASASKGVLAGEYVIVMEGPWVYKVLASGASNPAITTTTNSVKFELQGDPDVMAYGASGDGATNDSAYFTALETNFSSGRVDLKGRIHLVTSIPTGLKYFNGGFKLANAIGSNSDVDVIYPADETFQAEITQVSQGKDFYESWPQGKRHIVNISGNIYHYVAFNGSSGHDGGARSYVYVSTDGGASYQYDTTIAAPVNNKNLNCFSMGEYAGQQLAIVRQDDLTSGLTDDYILYGRRLWERRDGVTINVTTTNSSSTFDINVTGATDFGVKVGDTMRISGYGTVNNLNLNSSTTRYTVTNVGADYVRFSHPTDTANATSTADVVASTGVLVFNPDNDGFTAMDITYNDGSSKTGSLLTAMNDDLSSPFPATIPGITHDLETWNGGGGLSFKFGVSGNGLGKSYALQIDAVLRASRTISRWDVLGGLTEGGEPTFYRTSGGNWYGGIRGDDPAEAKLWYKLASEDLSDATVTDFTVGLGNDSPVDVVVDETNSNVYVVMTDTRYRDSTPGTVPLLLGWCSTTAYQTSGTAAFTFWKLHDLHFSNTNGDASPGRNAVGVQSTNFSNGVVYISYSDEHAPIKFDQDGQPRVYDIAIAVGPNGPIDATLPKRTTRAYAKAALDYIIPQEVGLIGGSTDADTISKASTIAFNHRKVLKLPPIAYDIQSQIVFEEQTELKGMGNYQPANRGSYKGPTLVYNISGGSTPMIRSNKNFRCAYVAFRGDGTGPAIQTKEAPFGSSNEDYDDTDSVIHSCQFHNFTIMVDHWNRGLAFTNNLVQSAGTTAIDLTYDKTNLFGSGYPAGGEWGFRAINIQNNRFHNSPLAIRNTGTYNGDLRGLVCTGNWMDLGDSFYQGGLKNGLFSGNLIDLSDTADAILDFTNPVTGVTITGNTFVGRLAANGDPTSHVWFGDTVENFTITGNSFQNADDSGVLFSSTADNGVISGNSFIDIGASSTDGCIHLLGNANHVSIVGNTFRPINSAYGIRANSAITTTNFTVANNTNDGGTALVLANWTMGANTFIQGISPQQVGEYTVAGAPSAANYDNTFIIVSNEVGGRTLATSDGTNWRRVSDGAVIS